VSDVSRPRAVLDADIIYSRVLHDLMGRAARRLRLLDLFWSEELLAEARTSLEQKKRLPPEAARRWVDYLPRNFPNGGIDLGESSAVPDLVSLSTDPADAHVCALAIAANADYLFTHDRGYLSDGLARYRVRVIAPDEFLVSAFDADPRGMLAVMELQAASWAGGRPIADLLDTIERAGASLLADRARAHI
jgi:predicted nucleic acid-binding protein